MSFHLKQKKYRWTDLVKIPFSCAPLCTSAVIGQKMLTGIVNVL